MTRAHGYIFFYLGLFIIILSALDVYAVFSGILPTIKYFHLPAFVLDSKTLISLGAKNLPSNATIELIPATIVNQFANLFAHLALMGFLASIGARVSGLGTNLLRPIEIQVKQVVQPKD